MLLALSLLGCASPVWGTWMFTREATLPTGEECGESLSHNFVGADTPEEAAGDTGWVETGTGEVSEEVFFGRIEATEDGAALILQDVVLPGIEGDKGTWTFAWTTSVATSESDAHASGYTFAHEQRVDETLRVAGTFVDGTFVGAHEAETTTNHTWSESDAWSEEAAAYVGENGELPAGDYLVVVDQEGTLVEANNSREGLECGDAGCLLSVQQSCAYRYDLTGTLTEFGPDDAAWVDDAGQAAGSAE